MAGVRGLEPRNAWIKTMCLNQLGHTPINIYTDELVQNQDCSAANRSNKGDLLIPFTT